MTAICRFVLELSELTTRPARQVTKVIAQLQQTESGTSHPIQEAAKAIARLKAEAAPPLDEIPNPPLRSTKRTAIRLRLDRRKINIQEYGSAQVHISGEYDHPAPGTS